MEQYLQPCISVNIRDFPRNEPFEELTQIGQITIIDEIDDSIVEDNVFMFWNATMECVVVEYVGKLFTMTDSSEMTTMELLERFFDMGVETHGSFNVYIEDGFEGVGLEGPFVYRIRDTYALSITIRGRFRDLNDA
jgi:hypothetical protein